MNKVVVIKKGNEEVIISAKADDVRFVLEEGARVTYVLVSGRGWVGRPCLEFECLGRGSAVNFLGLIFGGGNEDFSLCAIVRHVGAKTVSRMKVFSVLSDSAKIDFAANIVIQKGAVLADAHTLHRTLMLSPGVRVKTLPSLEISEKNVKAGHAATVGKADKDSLYYLESRGILKEQAKHLLIRAFLEGPLTQIDDLEKREIVKKKVERLLKTIK